MPLKECESNGRPGYKWGDNGKCYTYDPGDEKSRNEAKRRAYIQGYAIEGNKIEKDDANESDVDELSIEDFLRYLIDFEDKIIDLCDRAARNVSEKSTRDIFREIFHDESRRRDKLSDMYNKVRGKAADTGDVHVDRPVGTAQKFESDDSGTFVQTTNVSKSLYVPLMKIDPYQHKVYGVVLSPNEVDLQGDLVPPEEIEKASDLYMEQYRRIGVQHERLLDDAVIVQNYIAPVDFLLGSEYVKQGSWVMVIKIYNPEVWNDIVNGKLTGLSIGGIGRSTSV